MISCVFNISEGFQRFKLAERRGVLEDIFRRYKVNKKNQLDLWLAVVVKLFLFVALFCPISTTMAGSKHKVYYQEFLLVNAVILVFMLLYLIATIVYKRWNQENKVFCIKYLIAILSYGFFYWLMMDHIQWKWQGVNAMVSFGFFLLLMCGENREWVEKYHVIEFANRSIIISNLIGIVVYLRGYASVYWYNCKFRLMLPQAQYGEKRFDWIYYHKSQYAFMLLLSLAFILIYRHKFINRITFGLSVAVLMIGLYISHVNVAIVGGGLILGSFVLDLVIKNFKKINKKVMMIGIPVCLVAVAAVGFALFTKIAAERSVATLGSRTYIWKNIIKHILAHPEGLGNDFATVKFELPELYGALVNNGHNIFLNEMLRFSIPVGVCFIILFALIVIYSLEKKFSFFALGIWGAVMMSVSMDYAVMVSGWTLMLFFFYMIFFLDISKPANDASEELPKVCDGRNQKIELKTGKHDKISADKEAKSDGD